MTRRLLSALIVLGALTAGCTRDFDSAFGGVEQDITDAPSGPTTRDPDGKLGSTDGGAPTTTGDAATSRCGTARGAYRGLLGTPVAYYRLDDANGQPIVGEPAAAPKGTRNVGVERVATGAIREPDGAQSFTKPSGGAAAAGTIGFGDVWDGLGGGGGSATIAVELWFRLRKEGTHTIFAKGHPGAGHHVGYRLFVSGGNLIFERGTATAKVFEATIGPVTPGKWHHVVIERTGIGGGIGSSLGDPMARVSCILDGKAPVGPGDLDPADWVTTADWFALGPLDGEIDELAVHDRYLSPEDARRRVEAGGGCE